ncbi:hypothetical protein AB0N64_10905 [Microbacterium sp. NPDC089318]
MNPTKNKIGATVALLTVLGVSLVGCAPEASDSSQGSDKTVSTEKTASEPAEETPEPVSLVGEWKQSNSDDPERWQKATVTAGTIEVFWVADAGDTEALYWAGSVEVPTEGDSFTFDSVNDTEKTKNAILASGDETKTFTYKDGELSYDVTVQGVTKTVRLGLE